MGTHPIFESDFDCLTEKMFLSNQDVEKRRVREQQNQLNRNQFEKSARQDQMVRTINESEDRIMQKRWIQQKYEEEMEEKRIFEIEQTKREKEERTRREQQEEALAKELRRLKLEKVRDEKLRQQVRLESEELRALETKLNAAYMTKELEKQVKDKEEIIKAEIDAEIFRQAETERELAASHHAAAQVQTARIEANKKFQNEIEKQI